jgi:hypothetical protein
VQSCADSRTADAELRRQLAFGRQAIARTELSAFDERRDVPDDLVGSVTR